MQSESYGLEHVSFSRTLEQCDISVPKITWTSFNIFRKIHENEKRNHRTPLRELRASTLCDSKFGGVVQFQLVVPHRFFKHICCPTKYRLYILHCLPIFDPSDTFDPIWLLTSQLLPLALQVAQWDWRRWKASKAKFDAFFVEFLCFEISYSPWSWLFFVPKSATNSVKNMEVDVLSL